MDVGMIFGVVAPAGVNERLLVRLIVRAAGAAVVPVGTVITIGDHAGAAARTAVVVPVAPVIVMVGGAV
jgi:hypothetical protein